jgi:hypothetical protein
MRRIGETCLIAAMALMFCRCDSGANPHDGDFHTTGFIGEDRFQVVIKVPPSERARGLVERRESSLHEAQKAIEERAAQAMLHWILTSRSRDLDPSQQVKHAGQPEAGAEKTAADADGRLRQRMNKLARKGSIAIEYFDEDDSAVVVYRITSKNLKKSLLSLAETDKPEKNTPRSRK